MICAARSKGPDLGDLADAHAGLPAECVRTYWRRLRLWAIGYDEALSAAGLGFAKALSAFPGGEFRAFAFRCVGNELRMAVRSSARAKRRAGETLAFEPEAPAEQEASDVLAYSSLLAPLPQLPAAAQALLRMRFGLDGQPRRGPQERASAVGLTVTQARRVETAALERLRELLS